MNSCKRVGVITHFPYLLIAWVMSKINLEKGVSQGSMGE
jgi:hypothetical protein